jgi:hypothetical protein
MMLLMMVEIGMRANAIGMRANAILPYATMLEKTSAN